MRLIKFISNCALGLISVILSSVTAAAQACIVVRVSLLDSSRVAFPRLSNLMILIYLTTNERLPERCVLMLTLKIAAKIGASNIYRLLVILCSLSILGWIESLAPLLVLISCGCRHGTVHPTIWLLQWHEVRVSNTCLILPNVGQDLG